MSGPFCPPPGHFQFFGDKNDSGFFLFVQTVLFSDNLKRLYSTEEDPSLLQSMLKKAVDKNCADVYKRFSELLDSLDNLVRVWAASTFNYLYNYLHGTMKGFSF